MGVIYKIINNINNKIYIGQTSRPLKERWLEHLTTNKRRDLPLYKAFDKYGKENFQIEIVEECENSSLDEREIYWIDYYNSYKNGYNASLGGESPTTLSKEEVFQILKKWEEGKTLTQIKEETCHGIKTIRTYLIQNGISESSFLERSHYLKSLTRKEFSSSEKELILSLFKQGYSLTKISKENHFSSERVLNFLKENFSEEEIKENSKRKKTLEKPFYQYSLDNVFLKKYTSKHELKKVFTLSQIKCIQNCCRGAKKTAYGYKWSYTPLHDKEENI